jgi:hypothetical protein
MKDVKFQKRPLGPLVVCRNVLAQHPGNDLDNNRTYTPGETIDLRLDESLPVSHPDSLRARVIENGAKAIEVEALHPVFAKDRSGELVKGGDKFSVEREHVFVVWKL